MFDIGRVCIKIAGRDARKKCAILDILDDRFVKIDGETRRRKCNMLHLEPTDEIIEIEKGASEAAVRDAFKKIGIEIQERKAKESKERPRKIRKQKEKPAEDKKKKPKEKETSKKAEEKASKKKKAPAKKPVKTIDSKEKKEN